MCTLGSVHITFLLCKLHWLALCFWLQFRMLIMTYNILHYMILDYFRDCLSLAISTLPVRSDRTNNALGSCLLSNAIWWAQGKCYSYHGTCPLNHHHPEDQTVSQTLMAFHALLVLSPGMRIWVSGKVCIMGKLMVDGSSCYISATDCSLVWCFILFLHCSYKLQIAEEIILNRHRINFH